MQTTVSPPVRIGIVVLVVLSVVMAGAALSGPAGAVASPRTNVSGTPPAIVFQGEELNVTALGQTGGGTVGSGQVTFVGLAGNASGSIESDDAASVDFSTWATGSYDADDDDQAEIFVDRSRITDLTLELGNGADVTNGKTPSDEAVTVNARFNFDAADGLRIEVLDPDGLDVAPAVASSTRIDSDGGTVTLDFSDAEPGEYTVVAEARNLEASTSVSIGVDTPRLRLTLNRSTAVGGESVLAAIEADPGERYVLRVPASDLDGAAVSDSTAREVFADAGAVTDRRGSPEDGVVYAVLELDGNGEGRAVVRTGSLRVGNRIDLDVGRGTNPGASTMLTGHFQLQAPATTTAPTSVMPVMALAPDIRGVCSVAGIFVMTE